MSIVSMPLALLLLAGMQASVGGMSVANAETTLIKMGETAELPYRGKGINNKLMTQGPYTLAGDAELQSLSFWVDRPAGKMYLGIYDSGPNNDCRGGHLVGKTAAFIPVSGWNTQPVIQKNVLSPRDYCLAYLSSDKGLSYGKSESGSLRELNYRLPFAYGLPSQYAANPNGGDTYHSSVYTTLAQGVYTCQGPNCPVSLNGVSLSNNSFTASASSGTVVGNLSTTVAPPSGTFTGTYSAPTGPDAANFQIVSGNQLATNGVVAYRAAPYNITLCAVQTNSVNGSVCNPFQVYATQAIVGSSPTFNEEFVGPFSTWQSVKASPCNAMGDGSTDDTVHIQTCINNLSSSAPVIYFPAGTYMISDVSTTATQGTVGSTTITVGCSSCGITVGNIVVQNAGIGYGTKVTNVSGTTVTIDTPTIGALSGAATKFSLGMKSQIHVSLIGVDPATTKLLWAGSTNGVMFYVSGVAYSKINRLTFDGNNVARTIIEQEFNNVGGYFDVLDEYADDVFKNAAVGVRCGFSGFGCADITFLRCQFLELSQISVITGNFNALGIFGWWSLFRNVKYGIGNWDDFDFPGAGNVGVYNSVFLHSPAATSGADINTFNPGTQNIRYNYAVGSNQFTNMGGSLSADNVSVHGNTILDTTQPISMTFGNEGPYVILDNVVRSKVGVTSPVVTNTRTSGQLAGVYSKGNIFTVSTPVTNSSGGNTILDDTVVSPSTVLPTCVSPTWACLPALPMLGTSGVPTPPPNLSRTIFDVTPTGTSSDAANIAAAITSAVAAGTRSVVHLKPGLFTINATISVPASDIQIIGDGGNSILKWSGGASGVVLKLLGPSKVTLRDLDCDGNSNTADCIEIDSADQPNSRIFGEQVRLTRSLTANLRVNALDYTNVEMHNFTHEWTSLVGGTRSIDVIAGTSAAAGTWLGGATNIYSGDSSQNNPSYVASSGSRLHVRDVWHDQGGSGGQIVALSGSPVFTYAGSTLYAPPSVTTTVALSNFQGTASFVNLFTDANMAITGNGTNGKVMALGIFGPTSTFFSDTTSPADTMEFLVGSYNNGNAAQLPQLNCCDPSFATTTLNQLRTSSPGPQISSAAGVTEVSLYRVFVDNSLIGLDLKH